MYLLTDLCGTFEALTQRMQMYRDVADAISCSPKHYVDDNDLNALALYTQRSVYIDFYGNCNVRVICDDAVSAVPDVQQLSAVCFPDNAIVIVCRYTWPAVNTVGSGLAGLWVVAAYAIRGSLSGLGETEGWC